MSALIGIAGIRSANKVVVAICNSCAAISDRIVETNTIYASICRADIIVIAINTGAVVSGNLYKPVIEC
jgi:hypothetical protein